MKILQYRYYMNFFAAAFVMVGTICDLGVWYYVKDLKIFDDEIKDQELDIVEKEEEVTVERKV